MCSFGSCQTCLAYEDKRDLYCIFSNTSKRLLKRGTFKSAIFVVTQIDTVKPNISLER